VDKSPKVKLLGGGTRNWRVGRYFPRSSFLIGTAALDVSRANKRTIHFNDGSPIVRPKNHDVVIQEIVVKSVCGLVKFGAVR